MYANGHYLLKAHDLAKRLLSPQVNEGFSSPQSLCTFSHYSARALRPSRHETDVYDMPADEPEALQDSLLLQHKVVACCTGHASLGCEWRQSSSIPVRRDMQHLGLVVYQSSIQG
jgi:hypothetical protein